MAKTGKPTRTHSARRREELRRTLPKPVFDVREALQRPEIVNSVVGSLLFAAIAAITLLVSQSTIKVYEGQIAPVSRMNRIDYRVENEAATRHQRDEARKGAARVYRPNTAYLSRLRVSVEGLPRAVADRTSLDGVSRELVDEFGLTDSDIIQLQPYASDPIRVEEWNSWTERLFDQQLINNPLLSSEEYQIFQLVREKVVALPPLSPSSGSELVRHERIRGDATQLQSEGDIEMQLLSRAFAAGFPTRDLASLAITPMLRDRKPTLILDEEETRRLAEKAANAVPVAMEEHRRGDKIFVRGDRLTGEQIASLEREIEAFDRQLVGLPQWSYSLGHLGLGLLLAAMLCSYVASFYPQIARNPLRIGSLLGLVAGMSVISVVVASESPFLLTFVAVATTILSAMIFTLAYDRRLAMFVLAVQCVLTTAALEQGPATFLLLYAGSVTMILQLNELRNRATLVRASVVTAVALGIGSFVVGLSRVPLVEGMLWQVSANAAMAFGASLGVGILMVGLLPTLERAFGITTGLTLAELRDPRNALLRQLQQKAPGTYNHSLQVANIAEAAAEAIGADSLLTYVGALYHDIGKMNKPEYFVENQSGGVNKHNKLSPAMSLLVIVGHVKDGVELAREYKLPRPIRHFIEAHHGTTLVEYFFNAARSKAEAEGEGEEAVNEIAYRYPGPRPRTKEVAILMLADAVESAARTLAEPSAGSIESLVRRLARRRLEDGQFNECDLTLRELTQIENAIIKSLCAIYHGRISYPGTTISAGPSATTISGPATTAAADTTSATAAGLRGEGASAQTA